MIRSEDSGFVVITGVFKVTGSGFCRRNTDEWYMDCSIRNCREDSLNEGYLLSNEKCKRLQRMSGESQKLCERDATCQV